MVLLFVLYMSHIELPLFRHFYSAHTLDEAASNLGLKTSPDDHNKKKTSRTKGCAVNATVYDERDATAAGTEARCQFPCDAACACDRMKARATHFTALSFCSVLLRSVIDGKMVALTDTKETFI
jgi:hypothetical protein